MFSIIAMISGGENISADYKPLYEEALGQLLFWKNNLALNNFQPFAEPQIICLAWVDASDVAIGGFAAHLLYAEKLMYIVTADNWLLSIKGALRQVRNCVPLQVDVMPWQGQPTVNC
jgi:hypothetical protein